MNRRKFLKLMAVGFCLSPLLRMSSAVIAQEKQEEELPNKIFLPFIQGENYKGLVLFDGDSRTINTQYPFKSFELGGKLINDYKFINAGISGQNLWQMNETAKERIDILMLPNVDNILVVWGGINDGASPSSNPEFLYKKLQAYCFARKEAGWNKIIVCTEIDGQDDIRNKCNWHEIYPKFNQLTRDNLLNYVTAIADLGEDARLQNALNLEYFRDDKVHINSNGANVVASIVGKKLLEL